MAVSDLHDFGWAAAVVAHADHQRRSSLRLQVLGLRRYGVVLPGAVPRGHRFRAGEKGAEVG